MRCGGRSGCSLYRRGVRACYVPGSILRFADTALSTQVKSCHSLAYIPVREKRQYMYGQMLNSGNWKPSLSTCVLNVCSGETMSEAVGAFPQEQRVSCSLIHGLC